MHSRINLNGEIVSASTQLFGFDHPVFNSGEILQEKIRLFEGSFLFAERHYFHLMAQMRMARMQIPLDYTPAFFYQELTKIQEDSGLQNAELIFNVTQSDIQSDFWVSIKELPNTLFFNDDYEIDLYRETYVSGDFHQRLNFLNPRYRILSTYAKENSLDDLILLNQEKSVAHSMNGNIFMIQGNEVFTSSLEQGAFDNVLRDRVLQACIRAPEIDEIHEGEGLFPFKLNKADEVFIAKNGHGIIKVSKLRKKDYVSDVTKSIVSQLIALD